MAAPRSIHEYRDVVLSEHGPDHPLARLVALAVAGDMSSTTMECYSSAARIAARSGLSERAVRTRLAELVRTGWLTERTHSRGRSYWRKVRRAHIPDPVYDAYRQSRHPAPDAGSHGDGGDPARRAGSPPDPMRDPARGAGLPAQHAGLPARDDVTPCTGAQGDPARRADDLESRSRVDLGRDLGARARDEGTRSADKSTPSVPRTARPTRRERQDSPAERAARVRRALEIWPDSTAEQLATLTQVSVDEARQVLSERQAAA